MTPWQWWAGSYGYVEYENTYELGEFASRDDAIAAARKEWPGKAFYIVEARSSTAAIHDDEPHEGVPFIRQRNQELIEPIASEALEQVIDHIRGRSAKMTNHARRDAKWWQFKRKSDRPVFEAMARDLDLLADEIRDLPYDY